MSAHYYSSDVQGAGIGPQPGLAEAGACMATATCMI